MDTSPCAKLPAELRNQVFSLALSCGRITLAPTPSDRDITSSPLPRRLHLFREAGRGHEHPTALTQTCRQLRAETTGLFYSANTFVVKTYCHDYPGLISIFRHNIGPSNSSALQSMILQQKLGQGLTSTIPKDKAVSARSLTAGTHGTISGIEIHYDFGDGTAGMLHSFDRGLSSKVAHLVQHCTQMQQYNNQEHAQGKIDVDECVARFWRLNRKKQNLRLAERVLSR
ncbi:hypothetical protein CLAFUW4_07772 [Fulvia fulva]|uniref:Uncharacterized protein n=1 Tax=Passalora fulva TaxID=5499 RepID=A0A9Q8P6J1_PASFU|nr:uncharacterized protein CLAFUR5_07897 [Fulvia fulva]KAK4629599.1 hypothetical protein CLAFUR4_07777 [Fulvia fulva]KAK4630671.1 hypothetical protein CLAFUR0_07775 [Fulvia fulva]UJO15088.1 hypothetical protein CLAFUR5_07897 [Fulvia fulva]WPV12481.1 hypothetical protein CLAFUW4_07772 [Fulvia fulva]WPV27763.1 hypothetical protein CLAFUW7_07773 [Fulvia fulva]